MPEETSKPVQYVFPVSPELNEEIWKRFPDKTRAGHTSPLRGFLKAMVSISGALPYDLSMDAHTLWQCALKNAARFRKEQELRQLEVILKKIEQEEQEYSQVIEEYHRGDATLLDAVYRLSNVLYYSVQRYAHDNDTQAFYQRCEAACAKIQVPFPVALRCAAEKMRDRASRETKDVPTEYRKQEQILREAELL